MKGYSHFREIIGPWITCDTLYFRTASGMPDDHISFREPIPGMELRLERLLRFHFRFTIRNSFGPFNIDLSELSVAIISSGLFDTEHLHPTDFFMGVITRSLKLPPRCWARFTMSSKMKDIFKPLEPDTDDHARMMFALHLSSAILSTVGGSRKGLMQDFDSPLVLDFKHALPYFLDEIYGRVLRMFSNFVKDPSLHEPSLPQSLRVVVAAMEFLLHRLSVSESDMSFHESLSTAARWIRYQKFSSQEAKAVMTVLGDIFVPYVIPQRDDDIALQWHILCDDAILAYESLATTFPSACSLHDLQLMAHYMTINWDYAWNHSYRSDTACKVLATLLSGHIPAAFRVFLDNQCLEFLGNHAFHIASVSMVSEYVAGIFSMKHGSDGVVDAATLQLHMDYLHNPRNLFTVCSILATRGIKDTDEISIRRDITMLVQLRQRDAAWDECRRKLHDLAQSDAGGDFFGKQCIDFRPLQAEEVQVEKDNIGYAIQVLDDLFSGRVRTMVTSNSSSAQHRTGRIDRFLVSRLGRKSEAKSEQAQQV
ncbi:uncharacterized protein EV420DRAFT_1187425 [Desarmillaria tabescens]|uniref:Uncharacterized protein n=1 Tax=Armillaria tabescens TaxID=1929756 RepID=A0AA39TPZ7_ARMTA|nr:uncharacterized protein EV420DRAFT_1187425 [Desarmillaria tabescens]KAK0462433.1 hypothetical protein EV420DRAFT_1187425 [Desarmillaria tabescens]